MFDTKIAIIVRNDLATWQKLNVTAFLTSGLIAQNPSVLGVPYKDAVGNVFNPMSAQPIVILTSDRDRLRDIHKRAIGRQVPTSVYIEEMFETGHDAANREVFSAFSPDEAKVVGVAVRADKKSVDKITKGATMHS